MTIYTLAAIFCFAPAGFVAIRTLGRIPGIIRLRRQIREAEARTMPADEWADKYRIVEESYSNSPVAGPVRSECRYRSDLIYPDADTPLPDLRCAFAIEHFEVDPSGNIYFVGHGWRKQI